MTFSKTNFINTLLQLGVHRPRMTSNRFNGFGAAGQTVKTVAGPFAASNTQLKQGVNKMRLLRITLLAELAPNCSPQF